MKPVRVNIRDTADYDNLVDAAVKASRGKRLRPDVRCFFEHFEKNINNLRRDILEGNAPYGYYKCFTIYDPKKRTIHAACFEDRVLHHALINDVGSILERAMVPSTFACRPGKGPLAASRWVQYCIRRFPWYVKVDIRRYFDSIDHTLLRNTTIYLRFTCQTSRVSKPKNGRRSTINRPVGAFKKNTEQTRKRR
jgi:retron-type reverse transcriptase